MRVHMKKALALLLAMIMVLGTLPVFAFASTVSTPEWDAFLKDLRQLEAYAAEYAYDNPNEDQIKLVTNYIRTGIEKYTTSEWEILAGKTNTGFINFVAEKDAANGTSVASSLRNLTTYKVPNGQTLEFTHLFGALDIAYHNKGGDYGNADFGSWAGDLVDLLEFSYLYFTFESTDVEGLTAEVREKCLGIDKEGVSGFGILDIYADLDAFYVMDKLTTTSRSLSTILDGYYNANLTDGYRAAYFVKKRFPGALTKEEIRSAIYSAYTSNSGVSVLEADRNITELTDLRKACCNAFADFLYDNGKDLLPAANTFFEVFSSNSSTLAPGVTQQINYAMTSDEKQMVYYIATADVTRNDVMIMANYKDHDPTEWGMSRVTDQVEAAIKYHGTPGSANYIPNFNPVVATNADFYNMTTGRPSGALVMDGVVYNESNGGNFFAVLKDGTPVIGHGSDWAKYKNDVAEAVGASNYLVKDGKIYDDGTGSYYNSRHSRTAIGLTDDGRLVMMVLDGRQEPFSCGGTLREIAQIMLEAGCVVAVNLDGGGSTTFAAKQEGDDKITVVNSPSDGYARSVSSSIMIVSTAVVSYEFDHARVASTYDYLTVGTEIGVEAFGVSISGNAAEIPENAVWASSNEAVATVDANGVVTGVAVGDVDIQLMVDGEVVGKRTIHVILAPDMLEFERMTMNVVYGIPTPLPIVATYNEKPVAINASDVAFEFSAEDVATVDNFNIICNEESGIRQLYILAYLERDISMETMMMVSIYKNGEAVFDFDNATDGDRQFAWDRYVSNSVNPELNYYHIIDPTLSMDISYVFALDMEAIEVPPALEPLLGLVAGGDVAGVTAWQILLQLAERVNPMTTVQVKMQVDPNLDIDFSEITMVNDYFRLTSTEFDRNTNTLILTCNFIKQSQAVDPMTANPICIVSGIKAIVKSDAAWVDDKLTITNSGNLTYDIYLRANALYSFANDPANQKEYNIYPFVDTVINPTYNAYDKGGHFASDYANFSDTFTLDRGAYQGWREVDGRLYYYVDNEVVTGIKEVPSQEDPSKLCFYNFGEDGACIGKVNGLVETDGGLYYTINGTKQTGWIVVKNEVNEDDNFYYYFDLKTGKAVNGKQRIDGYSFVFTDHILTEGQLVVTSEGKMHYRWGNGWLMNEWIEIDGKKYYASYDKVGYGYFAQGLHTVHHFGQIATVGRHLFGEDYALATDFSGLYTDKNGNIYLIKEGIAVSFAGLVKIGNDYYYFREYDEAARSKRIWVSKTNGLLPQGYYEFGADGKMIDPPAPEESAQDGVVEFNGKLYYYQNGKLVKNAGLVKVGSDYYYFRMYAPYNAIVSGQKWITSADSNGYVPEGMYDFGADGKMLNAPEEAPDMTGKTGVFEIAGKLYYYENGELVKNAGLVKVGSDYYYFRTYSPFNGMVSGKKWITSAEANGYVTEGMYEFGADGKMLNAPADAPDMTGKTGIFEIGGNLYYYEDGELVKNAGLIKVDGAYYYFRTYAPYNAMVSGKKWIVPAEANGYVTEGMYEFGADGKMLNAPAEAPDMTGKTGIFEIGGKLYYYENGELVKNAGLIKVDGAYYYFRTYAPYNAMVSGKKWITAAESNGYVIEGMYEFDAEGKMLNAPAEAPDMTGKTGIFEIGGNLYYYENGELVRNAGLIEVDGAYYYFRTYGSYNAMVNGQKWITAAESNGYVTEGMYTFGADGKMIIAE